MASEHTHREIPRPAPWPLENLTKIAAQNLDGFLFMAYLLSRTVVHDEGADLYDLRFYRQSMNHKTFEVKTKDIKTYEGVYCDMLEDIFTDVTGLYTRF